MKAPGIYELLKKEFKHLDESSLELLKPYSDNQFPTGCNPTQTIKQNSSIMEYKSKRYNDQYSQMYSCRLHQIKPYLIEKAQKYWDHIPIVDTLSHIALHKNECIIIGVLYKDMKLKPSILDEYMKELNIEVSTTSFLSDTDKLYLEDKSVRLPLVNNANSKHPIDPNTVVSGLVIACLGYHHQSEFIVNDWILPGFLKQTPSKHIQLTSYVGFIAGLELGMPNINYNSVIALRNFFTNDLESDIHTHYRQSINRVVLIGNTIYSQNKLSAIPSLYPTLLQSDMHCFEDADIFLSSLATHIPLDVVPGPNDPTNYNIPQYPLHPSLFPNCKQNINFKSVTNPYDFIIGDRRCCTLGPQSVEDILQYTNLNKPIDALSLIIESLCLFPTCPDTLPCYPFVGNDPFVLDESTHPIPSIYVSGGHETLDYRYVTFNSNTSTDSNQAILLISVPNFTLHPVLILVNIITLEITQVVFN